MNYPRMVFKCPGKIVCQGGTYNHHLVHDETEHAEALEAGWHNSIPDALNPDVTAAPKEPAVNEDRPPTREEIEAKANELGIKFRADISDDRLMGRIAEVLGGE